MTTLDDSNIAITTASQLCMYQPQTPSPPSALWRRPHPCEPRLFRVLHTGAGVGRKAASRHVQHVLTIISFIATLPPVTVQPATAPVYTTTQTMHMKPKMTSLLVNKFKAT